MAFTNFQPGGYDAYTSDIDKLQIADARGESATLLQDAGATADLKRGQLLILIPASGKLTVLAAAETTVALNASGEVLVDNMQNAQGVIPRPFKLAKPPIPGTVTLATTADASATPVLALGTDNGRGYGSGAGGWFVVDYDTGLGVAYPNAAATNGDDLKAGYKHRNPASGTMGFPYAILAEDVAKASLVAGDVVAPVYRAGVVSPDGLIGYSAGYREIMKTRGFYVRVTSVQ